jgi:lysophospholipase
VEWTEHRFVAFDGTPIFYRRSKTIEKPKAAVLLVHGMGEHGGRYRHVAEYLVTMGFECFVPDLRGFGRSGGNRGSVRAFSDFTKDLAALHNIAERETKSVPLFLLGHSFGGLIASSYAAGSPQSSGEVRPQSFVDKSRQSSVADSRQRLAGLILTSPIFGIKIPVPVWRHALGLMASYLAPNYSQPTHVDPRTLTHDAAILKEYSQDALIHHRISARLYRELIRAIANKQEMAASIHSPVLLLQSGQDVVVDAAAAREFFATLRVADKEIETYDEFYHEILNETGRARVLSRIGLWISDHLS